jgi:hypothetical protein
LSAAVMLGIGVYVLPGRRRRLRDVQRLDDSLRGRLDRAIANLDALIARDRAFFWWFILPWMLVSIYAAVETFPGRPVWVWLLQPLVWLLAWLVVRAGVSGHYVPKRRELAELRPRAAGRERRVTPLDRTSGATGTSMTRRSPMRTTRSVPSAGTSPGWRGTVVLRPSSSTRRRILRVAPYNEPCTMAPWVGKTYHNDVRNVVPRLWCSGAS